MLKKKKIDAAVVFVVLFGVVLGGLAGEIILASSAGGYFLYVGWRGVARLRARRAGPPES